MYVLVACEESQTVCLAFRNKGHQAYSCDVVPTRGQSSEWHIISDVRNILHLPWDMLIAFPPCTHLCVSGARHFEKKRASGVQNAAIDFFMTLVNAPIHKIAIENPVGIMSTRYRKPDQIIQPYNFGHSVSKRTCLWLKNLPLLKPTQYVPPSYYVNGKPRWNNQSPCGADKTPPSNTRGRDRSVTYSGIADAMAEQWG